MRALPETFSGQVNWVRSQGIILNADQARCIDVLCTIAQPYNLQLIGDRWAGAVVYDFDRDQEGQYNDDFPLLPPVELGANWVTVRLLGALSTFDGSELTRLVLAGHEHAVRVQVSAQIYRWVDRESFISVYDPKKDEWVETDEHPTGPGACLRIQLNARQREGTGWERHPTIREVIERG